MNKFVSYVRADGTASWGAVVDDAIVDLADRTGAKTLADAIAADALPTEVAAGEGVPFAEAQLLPVIPEPKKIICIGVNYKTHRDEIGKPGPTAPIVFARYADSQIAAGADAIKPSFSDQFDYEGELALVIGAPAFRVKREDAAGVIAGYSIYNDFSVRDWQRAASQWMPGKTFPGTGAFGPWFVPAAELGDVTQLTLETRVNGEVRQSASLADLVFDIPFLIEYVSTFTPLSPGDVIVTGTPGGVGLFMEPSGLLNDGDVVEVEVSGIGVLRNTVREQ